MPSAACKAVASRFDSSAPHMASKTCKHEGCDNPRYRRSNTHCYWHWLDRQDSMEQVRQAGLRRGHPKFPELRTRVPQSEWPEGMRWCSGCQWFVPLWYCRGARCRACASQAAYAAHVERTYEITEEERRELEEWQGGRCYVCGRYPRDRRLAVDHDHQTGEVRGLLCSDDQWGCNRTLARLLNDLEAARRLVAYVERPPLQRMRSGERGVARLTREQQTRLAVLGRAD